MENFYLALQLIMSTNTNQLPKRNKFITSSVIFSPNSEAPRPQALAFPLNIGSSIKRELQENVTKPQFSQTRNFAAQSVIFSNNSETKMEAAGFSKLESMARHIGPQAEEASTNSSISQNQPFKTTHLKKEGNLFISQIMTNRNHHFHSNEPNHPNQEVVRKRRQSVGIETFNRQGVLQQNLRFLQRVTPVLPQKVPASKMVDCESTNSGSGNQLLKPKAFNFLKKRKEQCDPNGSQSLKPFQPLKKADQMWPLSISPMEQKSNLIPKQATEEPPSASKLEYKNNKPDQNAASNIQFKKKKGNQNEINPKRFVFRNNEGETPVSPSDFKQKTFEDNFFLKNRTPKHQRQLSIKDFQLLDKLGKGAFGQVYLALEKNLGFLCVIKKMSKKRIKQGQIEEHIIREIKLQSYLNNSHCTSLYGYFHDEEHLYLILELLPDGSLQQVKKKRKLPEKEAADIVRQVALGLKHMHQEFIIHRDLKPENVFMNQGYVKIGDFGCSIYHNETGLRNTIVGCLQYSSPEQLFKQGYTEKIDSWSLGILTYELLFGKSPFESDIKKIVKSGDKMQELSQIVFPSTTSIKEETKKFILNLLQNNPDVRMDMDQVLSHPFLREQKPIK